jgi:hypothetical protein
VVDYQCGSFLQVTFVFCLVVILTMGGLLPFVVWGFVVILRLLFISGFAGLLPVVSWVLECKWLIINGIRFCRFVFSARCCCDRVLCSFLFRFKKKRTKRKGNFLSIAPLTKK